MQHITVLRCVLVYAAYNSTKMCTSVAVQLQGSVPLPAVLFNYDAHQCTAYDLLRDMCSIHTAQGFTHTCVLCTDVSQTNGIRRPISCCGRSLGEIESAAEERRKASRTILNSTLLTAWPLHRNNSVM